MHECRYCLKHNTCSIKYGMIEIYKKIDEADNLILAAPTYLYGVPGPMKIMLDRFQVYWAQVVRGDKPEVIVKKGAIIVSGGAPRFENQFTGIGLELADSLHVCNVKEVGRVFMDDADRMKSLDESPEIKEELIKIAELLN